MWQVAMSSSVRKKIEKLPLDYKNEIFRCIYNLRFWPDVSDFKDINKMSDNKDTYRIRIGVYRLIFKLEKEYLFIKIVKVAHRKDAYKK